MKLMIAWLQCPFYIIPTMWIPHGLDGWIKSTEMKNAIFSHQESTKNKNYEPYKDMWPYLNQTNNNNNNNINGNDLPIRPRSAFYLCPIVQLWWGVFINPWQNSFSSQISEFNVELLWWWKLMLDDFWWNLWWKYFPTFLPFLLFPSSSNICENSCGNIFCSTSFFFILICFSLIPIFVKIFFAIIVLPLSH